MRLERISHVGHDYVRVDDLFELRLPDRASERCHDLELAILHTDRAFTYWLPDPYFAPMIVVADLGSQCDQYSEISTMPVAAAKYDAAFETLVKTLRHPTFKYFQWRGTSVVSLADHAFYYSECLAVPALKDPNTLRWLRFNIRDRMFLVSSLSSTCEFDSPEARMLSYMTPRFDVADQSCTSSAPGLMTTIVSRPEVAEARRSKVAALGDARRSFEVSSVIGLEEAAPTFWWKVRTEP